MSSLIQNYEYDIFISYRHNDNRSGWVRDFVHHLQEELASTLKEPASIYFDENPHDGLLETDLVIDSLNDKLKCLIFIPILSQTYCDPKSFAWRSEFLVFKKLASEDSIGIKVKLTNGNTTSRILPVKIHDLDQEDKVTIENELGPLRSIDFIFRSPGVNRPLTLADGRAENLNKTFYRDQVNKVANCIKETIGILKGGSKLASVSQPDYTRHFVRPQVRKRLAWGGGIALFLLIASFLSYQFFQPGPESLDRSIAVLPFQDLSQNHDQEYFSDGISEEIINALVKIDGLKVPSRTSSFQFKGKNVDLSEIGDKLNVSLILEGSVRRSGDHLRITAQLNNAENGYHLWSETYNHDLKDIFQAQDEITKDILKQLQKWLGVRGTLVERKMPTQNLEAYELYLKGHQQFLLKGEHVLKAQELLKEAVRLAPNFAMAHAALAEAYSVHDLGFGNSKEALASAYHALAIDSMLSSAYAVIGWNLIPRNPMRFPSVKDADLMHSNFERAIELDPQNSTAHLWFGIALSYSGLYRQALDQLRIAVQIDPLVPINYGVLGITEFLHDEDSLGFLHLQEGIRLGWKAGNQRMAFYYLEHGQWEKAEYHFKEHASLVAMSMQFDYHQLVLTIKNKDIQGMRRMLDPMTDRKGFIAGFKARIYYLVGDYERTIPFLDDWGISEATRPSRKKIREHPGFRKYIEANGVVNYWKKYGWPDVCYPVGENDFNCD